MILFLLACDGPPAEAPSPETPPTEASPGDGPAAGGPPANQGNGSPKTDASGNPICPDGRTVFRFWPGEYPDPVLQVNSPVTLKVATDPCAAPSRECQVSAGLYHPWVENLPARVQFRSRTAPTVYIAGDADKLAGDPVEAGTEVTVLTYLAEGMCSMQVGTGEVTEDMCPGTESDGWTEKPRTAPPDDQLVQVPCEDNSAGWLVVDRALIEAHEEMVLGEVVGFGEVKASE